MRIRTFASALFMIALAACQGDMGPMGPQGPAGPQGQQGIQGPPGADFQYFIGASGVGSDGVAQIALPIGAGDATRQPLVTCYIGDGTGVWLIVGLDVYSASCGLVWSNGRWYAAVIDAPSGWQFRVVAVW